MESVGEVMGREWCDQRPGPGPGMVCDARKGCFCCDNRELYILRPQLKTQLKIECTVTLPATLINQLNAFISLSKSCLTRHRVSLLRLYLLQVLCEVLVKERHPSFQPGKNSVSFRRSELQMDEDQPHQFIHATLPTHSQYDRDRL